MMIFHGLCIILQSPPHNFDDDDDDDEGVCHPQRRERLAMFGPRVAVRISWVRSYVMKEGTMK